MCIDCDRVFYQCSNKANVLDIEIPLNNIEKIRFKQGFIVDGTLRIYDIDDDPNYKNVMFEIKIPFEARSKDGTIYKGVSPNIKQNIVIIDGKYEELQFKLEIDTRSYVLGDITTIENESYFSFETCITISIVKKVQILIPYLEYFPEFDPCLEFKDYICDEFYKKPFPQFYPPQYKKGYIWIRKDIGVRKIDDVIIHGQIYKNGKNGFVEGAIVEAFCTDEEEKFEYINHTYSNKDGYYMLNIPSKFEGKVITIMVSKGSISPSG
ncbi:hypothetical protein JL105_08845 [Keratinibaculum paraultunense]|uniref:hypothetical protein n=1 Tax=Keratinibaculum paraultunense TaxID=1278232 RepID=UPI0010466210|nr:hypothetical protein [Keratinibaculum paraultunense]QQY79289.1 hypothetical protein JL105_08845 [Keratinibaculum paraultunense]